MARAGGGQQLGTGAGDLLAKHRTLLLLECREAWVALRCSRGVVPLVQKDRSKSVSSACPLALSRMFSGFRSLGRFTQDSHWQRWPDKVAWK